MKFIFQVVIKEGRTVDEYVEAWQRASVIIQGMPGARGTRLHRAIDSSRSLLAIAEWDSKEAREQAVAHLRQDPATSSTLARHREIGDFSLVGEFDDAEWTVVPDRTT